MLPLGSRRRAGRAKRISVVVIGATLIASLGTASAATLGGLTSASLLGQDAPVSALAGTRITCDNFTLGATAVNGRAVQTAANCGTGVWASHTGTWSITAGQAGASNTANANASVPVGSTDMSAEVTLLNANAAARIGGVAVSHTGSTRIYVAGVVSALNTVQIRFVNNGMVTTLVTTAAVPIGASTLLRLTRQGTTITLRVDGTVRATATLTPAQVTSLAAGTRAGLYASSATALRFSNFLVTTPFP